MDYHEPFRDKYDRWENMSKKQIVDETGDVAFWNAWHNAKRGRLVIRLIEGGNDYMKIGDSYSGTTRAFAVGLPLVIEYPNGYYQSSFVEEINWENKTFRTQCSTYSFHFCVN